MFIFFVLLLLSASHSCPDEYKCSSGTGTLPDIHSSIGNDTHRLDLSCRGIEILDPEYFSKQDVTNFTSFHLNNNCIQTVTAELLKDLVALKHLFLQNNQIDYIHPSAFQSNEYLITLDLSGNKLQKLHPITFQKNVHLLWVNITGNPMNASAVEPALFDLSLNTIDTGSCNNTESYINYFQAIPYLRALNLKEDATFTVGNLMSYQNITDEVTSLENYMFHKLLSSGYNNSSKLRYDRIKKAILGPSNTSLMCFSDRLSAWFWYFERPSPCPGHSADIYSLLNCSVTPTETPLPHTSSTSSAPALSTTPSAGTATTGNTTNSATDTSTSNKYPQQATLGNHVTLFLIGFGVILILIIVIIISIVIYVVRLRRKRKVPEQGVRYSRVSRESYDPSCLTTYSYPLDKWRNNTENTVYDTPYAHNQMNTFRPLPSMSARGDNVRQIFAEF